MSPDRRTAPPATPTGRTGRPRDTRIDAAVHAAALELLAESGYADTTIQAVARRSGVPAPTIYRRWPNRAAMIEATVFPRLEVGVPAPAGELERDIQAFVTALTEAMSAPSARAAVLGLLNEYQSDPERHRGVADRIGMGMRDAFQAMLDAQPEGSVDDTVDPDFALDMLVGSVLFRLYVLPTTGRRPPVDQTATVLARALRA